MRKALSLVLAFLLSVLMCACEEKTETDNTPTDALIETISEDALFLDTTNGAKCSLNVGKQVTVLGQVTTITSETCRIRLVCYPTHSVLIQMPVEKLAELYTGQFIAVVGVVESYSESGILGYTLSAKETMDTASMDAVFRERTSFKYDNERHTWAGAFEQSIEILSEYMNAHTDLYVMDNNEELKEYLCGVWECGYYKIKGRDSFTWFTITYNKDGSAEYSKQNSYRGDWEVSDDGMLQSFFGSKTVCVLFDDVFICDDYIFVRQNS